MKALRERLLIYNALGINSSLVSSESQIPEFMQVINQWQSPVFHLLLAQVSFLFNPAFDIPSIKHSIKCYFGHPFRIEE